MKFDYKNIDFLVLLPCPMKAAFGIIANQISIEYTARSGNRVNFLPVSGMDVEVIHDLMSIENAEDFPAVMMIPGMGIPYSKRFMEKFRNEIQFVKGYFYLEEHIIKLIFALIKQKIRRLKS